MPALEHLLSPLIMQKAREISASLGPPSSSYLKASSASPYGNILSTGQAAFGDLGSKGGDAFAAGLDQGAEAGRAKLLKQDRQRLGVTPANATVIDPRAIDYNAPSPDEASYLATMATGRAQATANDVLGGFPGQMYTRGMDQGIARARAQQAAANDAVYPPEASADPAAWRAVRSQAQQGAINDGAVPVARPTAYLNIDNRSPMAPIMRNVDASKLRVGKSELAKALKRGAMSYDPNDITTPDALMLNSLATKVPVGDVEGVRRFFGGPVGGPFYNGINSGYAAAASDRLATGAVKDPVEAMHRGELAPTALENTILQKPFIIDPKQIKEALAADAVDRKSGKNKKLPKQLIIPGNLIPRKMAYLAQDPNVRTLERGNADVYQGDTDPFAQQVLGYPNDKTVY